MTLFSFMLLEKCAFNLQSVFVYYYIILYYISGSEKASTTSKGCCRPIKRIRCNIYIFIYYMIL